MCACVCGWSVWRYPPARAVKHVRKGREREDSAGKAKGEEGRDKKEGEERKGRRREEWGEEREERDERECTFRRKNLVQRESA